MDEVPKDNKQAVADAINSWFYDSVSDAASYGSDLAGSAVDSVGQLASSVAEKVAEDAQKSFNQSAFERASQAAGIPSATTPNPDSGLIDPATTAALLSSYPDLQPEAPVSVPEQPAPIEPVSDQGGQLTQQQNGDGYDADVMSLLAQSYGLSPQVPLAGLRQQQDAVRRIGEIEQAKANEQAAHLAYQAGKIDTWEERARDRRKKYDEELESFSTKLQEDTTKWQDQKIDTGRYFKNMSTAGKIMAGISLALGAFDMKGNQAADLITKQINTDINAQRADYQRQGQALQVRRGIYSDMRQRYMDDEQAMLASQRNMILAAKAKADAAAARFEGQIKGENGKLLSGQLQSRADEIQYRMQAAKQQSMQQQLAKSMAYRRPLSSEEAEFYLPEDERKRHVNGYMGLAKKEEYASDFIKDKKVVSGAKNAIDELIEIANSADATELAIDGAMQGRIAALRQWTAGGLRLPIMGPGVLDKTERALLMDIIADPSSLTTRKSRIMGSLNTISRKLQTAMDDQATEIGLIVPHRAISESLGERELQ